MFNGKLVKQGGKKMIFDNIKNCKMYYKMNPKFEKAFDFIQKAIDGKVELGKHQIDGEEIYALVQNYDSILKENSVFEGHEKYIDIQYVMEGIEMLGFLELSKAAIKEDYDAEIDAAIYKESDIAAYCIANKGDFCIFFPQDIHSPGVAYNNVPSNVKKIVVKVHI